MVIGVDVDGVLADFVTGFCKRVVEVTGRDLFGNGGGGLGPDFPNCWDYHLACGYTKEEDVAVWTNIGADPVFWFSLPPLGGTLTARAAIAKTQKARWDGHDIYFITSRFGIDAKMQTEGWLRTFGAHHPTVLLCHDKATACKILNVDVYIDDRLKNCNDTLKMAREDGREMRVYLKDAPYNDRPVAELAEGQMGVTGEQRRDPGLLVVPDFMAMCVQEGL